MKEFTFPDSGVKVLVRRVSPLLGLELRKKYPPPKAPFNEVDYGDGHKRRERNLADPDFLAEQEKYDEDMTERLQRLILRRGVVLNLTEDMLLEVKELRDFWKAEYEDDLPGSDRDVYLTYIAVSTERDLQGLVDEVLRHSQPTEGEVSEALNSFPDQVSGA